MNLRIYLISIILCLGSMMTSGQEDYSDNAFILPLDFHPVLSGTFGELRSNHFHSGIDIKTQGSVGKPVLAIDDGYVSRIKVSPSGFGNTLYINHEGGYTSVFAHLNGFRKDIADYVKSEQYSRESFAVDLYLEKDQILVKKGEVIALSGNSGYSFGPHLHFEIREATTQKPINPLLFGFKIKDDIPPKIKKLKIYPETPETIINSNNLAFGTNVTGYGKNHYVENIDTIYVYGEISFGLLTYDLLNGAGNKNGIYEMRIRLDNTTIYHLRMEKFAFAETRYINSLIDYAEYQDSRQRFIRSKLDPNNRLNVYETIINDGVISITDSSFHVIKFEVKDVYNNLSELSIGIKGVGKPVQQTANQPVDSNRIISWRDESNFEASGLSLFVPAYSFYDNILLDYNTLEKIDGVYSAIHSLGTPKIPVHKYLTLSIQPEGLPVELQEKALLARVNGDKDQKISAAGGTFKDGMISAKIREFGRYTVVVDTIPPHVRSLNAPEQKTLARGQRLKFWIKDEFSGIKSYRGTMNGNWVLMQYDAKNDFLYYIVDEYTIKGVNRFLLEVSDQKDNKTIFEAELKLN